MTGRMRSVIAKPDTIPPAGPKRMAA